MKGRKWATRLAAALAVLAGGDAAFAAGGPGASV